MILTWIVFAYKSCSPANSTVSNAISEANPSQLYNRNKQQTPEKQEFKDSNIDFKGVSFTYDPKILGKVTAEDIPDYRLEQPDYRPDEVEPRHVIFTFDSCKTDYCWEGFIAIYPLEDFPRMYSVNKDMMQEMEKEVEAFRKVVNDKNVLYEGEIPYLRWVDASQSFQTNVKLSQFDKGKGIFLVTYMNTEMALISNDHLRYIFEGLTDDGKYYVLADMPVTVKFLPDEPPREFEGYKEEFLHDPYPYSVAHNKRYKNYISSITRRLEKLPASSFHPDLKYLEKVIASLRIEK